MCVRLVVYAFSCLTKHFVTTVLVLRGLLSSDILFDCLKWRVRVNYGVSRLPGAKKRVAIPFRAADEPSHGAKYITIVLTYLAYFNDGLSRSEIVQAIRALECTGGQSQIRIYNSWFELCKPRLSDEDALAISDFGKIDLSNVVQRDLLYRAFAFLL
jgi:hypothetical protein